MDQSPESPVLGFIDNDVGVDIIGGVGIGYMGHSTLVGLDIVLMFEFVLVITSIEMRNLVSLLWMAHDTLFSRLGRLGGDWLWGGFII